MKTKINFILTLILMIAAAGALNAQTVTVNPTSLSFSAVAGGSAQTQQLTVSNSSGAPQFDAVSNVSWLKINGNTSVVNLATPATLNISADPTGLTPGPYSINNAITVFGVGPTGQFGPQINVPVSFTVGVLGVSPSSVPLAYQIGGTVPGASLTLSAATTTAYTVSLGSGCSFVQQPANGNAPGTLALALNAATVASTAPGTYTCNVTITPASGPAITVPITLTVTGAPTVTYSPTAINLVYQTNGASGSTNTPSQTLTLTNPGIQALSFSISPGAPWLTATPNQGTIPASGSVQVAVAYATSVPLSANTLYTASLGVLVPGATNNAFNVPVSLLTSNQPLVNMSTAPVSFTYQVGGSVPSAKTVLATTTAVDANATSGQLTLLLTANTSNGGGWLSVPQSATTGTAFPISLNASVVAALSPGTYTGTVSVVGLGSSNATTAQPLNIPVTLKVSNDPLVTATFGGCTMGLVSGLTCPLSYPYQVGQNNPTAQTVTVASSTGAALTVTATAAQNTVSGCPANWLSASALTAGANNTQTFMVSANPAGVTNGSVCTGNVTVNATASSGNAVPNGPLVIPVTLYVNNSAMLVVNPTALSFTAGVNQVSTLQYLTVTSTGTAGTDQLSFTATHPAADNWLLVDGSLHTTATGTIDCKVNAQSCISVIVNSSNLAPGTYSSTITITAAGAGVLDSPVSVPVTMTVTGATMTVSPASGLSFSQTLGAAPPAAKTVTVSTSGPDIAFNTTVTMQNGTGWLNATSSNSTATSSTPAQIQVSVNGSNLAAGTYNGSVVVTATSAGVSGSPVTIPVTFVVAPGTLAVSPAILTFTEVAGTAAQSQPITITGTPGALNYTIATATANNGNWLSVSSASGTTGSGTVNVTANNTGLQPGQYTGTVTVTSPGATGSPQTVNVTLNVVAAQTITVSPTTLNFNYIIGTQTTLQVQQVQVTSSGTGATFTATPSSSAAWLVVSPTTGTAPATLNVSIQPAGLAAGNYTGTIAITSPSSATSPAASVTVNLTVTAVPKPTFSSVANAASYVSGAVSPGENIVIFGTGLGPATLALGHLTNGVFDTTVSNTRVLFDGVPAPIIYTRADQTSVMVPYGVAGRPTTNIVVEYQGVQSNPLPYNVVGSAPGIYTLNQSGSGPGAILNQDLSVNSNSNAAAKNSVVVVYMTGEGTTQPASTDGAVAPTNGTGLYKPILPVTATIGGQPATVEYYGSAPGIVYGVMQVNIRVPAGAPSGASVPVVVTVGTNGTQSGSAPVTLAIQ